MKLFRLAQFAAVAFVGVMSVGIATVSAAPTMTVNPEPAVAGSSVDVTFNASAGCTLTATGNPISLVLTDGPLALDPIVATSAPVVGVAGSTSITFTIAVPAGTAPGSYSVGFKTATNRMGEDCGGTVTRFCDYESNGGVNSQCVVAVVAVVAAADVPIISTEVVFVIALAVLVAGSVVMAGRGRRSAVVTS